MLQNTVVEISGNNESEQFHKNFESSAKRVADISEFEQRLDDATEENDKLSILMEYIDFEMQSNFSMFCYIFLFHIQTKTEVYFYK